MSESPTCDRTAAALVAAKGLYDSIFYMQSTDVMGLPQHILFAYSTLGRALRELVETGSSSAGETS